jgi:heme/copper-type cytochrome/quinol oxidase subunit 1
MAMLGLSPLLRSGAFEGAHLHFGLAGVTLTAFLGGLVQWWPMLTGREVDEPRVSIGALGLFVGLLLGFGPHLAPGAAIGGASALGPAAAALSLFGAYLSVGSVTWVLGVLLLGLRAQAGEAR